MYPKNGAHSVAAAHVVAVAAERAEGVNDGGEAPGSEPGERSHHPLPKPNSRAVI